MRKRESETKWQGTLIRIAVTPRAYLAIKGVLPPGSVVLNPERDERGRCLLTLDEGAANNLSLKRRLGESMSDVIIRLAQKRTLKLDPHRHDPTPSTPPLLAPLRRSRR